MRISPDRRFIQLAALSALLITAVACSSSTKGDQYGDRSAARAELTVATRKDSLGTYLVDGSGRTLYLFEKDSSSTSTCNGDCATAWPPVTTTGTAIAGSGVTAGLFATSKRSDDSTQLTYAGHPLYYYAGDRTTGETHGQGLKQFGAGWYVLNPAGAKIDPD